LQARKNVANLCRRFHHQKEVCLSADLEKQIEVSIYLLPEKRQKPHIQNGWGCYEGNCIQRFNSFRPGRNTCND
jgi:hypothetical protein